MRNLIPLFLIAFIVSLSSCRKDFDTVASSGNLGFSKDTVYLDTVFSNIGSSTYTLKVYNRSNDDIKIPKIQLGKTNSKYRMMIDGLTGEDADLNGVGDGRVFNDVELLAKDSLYIFIETTADIADIANNNPTEFLYTDDILFDNGSLQQKVNLVTLIKDAYFLYPKRDSNGIQENLLLGTDENGDEVRINGFELDPSDPVNGDEFHFTNTKPYVIYGYAGVPIGKTLNIDAGARVYFHADSGILVQPGGTLNVNGTASPDNNPLLNEVTFEGDRLEPLYEDVPGQWGTIWMREGSIANKIKHLTVKNATVGLFVDNCVLDIEDSQIYNSANFGILAKSATMNHSKNLVVNLAGQTALLCEFGGSYDFRHCTFNNNWSSSKQLAVHLNNYYEDENGNQTPYSLVQANFYNCIIYGSNNIEFFLDKFDDSESPVQFPFRYELKYCLFKFRDAGTSLQYNHPEYDFIREDNTLGNTRNKDPKFFDANRNKLNISDDPEGGAYQKGSLLYIIPNDVLGHLRTSNPPDLGAYQSAAFPE
ncbi:hypothetical protein [Flavobacterium sp.]|uniref:hypothetical protein n=1 Tax=Flavobacterium sp. TaxID=239 RepID=UPI00261B2783|nr:hypothetical protein [Flavobacterium sp.]